MFAIFGGMGLGLTANKYISKYREAGKGYCGQVVAMTQIIAFFSGFIVGAIIYIGAKYISNNILNAPQLENELKISSFILFLSAMNGSQIGTLQGLESYRKLAFASLCQGISALPLFIAGTYYMGLTGAILAYAANIALYTVVLQITINKELKQQGISIVFKDIAKLFPIFWKFSFPAALSGFIISPFKWLSEASLAKYSGFSELGIFQAVIVVTSVLISVSSTLNAPLISISSNEGKNARSRKMQLLTLYGSWYLFLIIALPFLLIPDLLILLFGEKFNDPHLFSTSLILLLYCGMLMYYQGIIRVLILNDSLWFAFMTNIFEGVTLITVYYIFRKYGAIGLGYGYVGSYIGRILISIPFMLRRKMLDPEILFDKYFLATFTTFFLLVLVLLKIWAH
jgi:O-antigen/teichoic acid export membrane protein